MKISEDCFGLNSIAPTTQSSENEILAVVSRFITTFHKPENVEYVKFDIHPLQKNKKLVRTCMARVIDRRMVSDSGGKKEKRYVIKSALRIGEVKITIELTLANRDTMTFRMLLGRDAVKQLLHDNPELCDEIENKIREALAAN